MPLGSVMNFKVSAMPNLLFSSVVMQSRVASISCVIKKILLYFIVSIE